MILTDIEEKMTRIKDILLTWRKSVYQALAKELNNSQVWQQRIAEGKPALEGPEVPLEQAADAFVTLVREAELQEIGLETARNLLTAYLNGTLAADELVAQGLNAARGEMYLHLAAREAMACVAAIVQEAVSLEHWRDKECPVCGSSPTLAYFDEEGRRMVICGTCTTNWRYHRTGCPLCGEREHKQILVLDTEELPGWIVQTCFSCRGYIKIADLRKMATRPDWQNAEIATLPLDFAVENWLSAKE